MVQSWLNQEISTDQLRKVRKVVEVAFLAFLLVNLCVSYPIWALRPYIAVRGIWRKIVNTSALLMHGNSLQIAALAREVANLKGRLSFLWNTERIRRGQHHPNGNGERAVRCFDAGVNSGSVRRLSNSVLVCTFFGGLVAGWALSLYSVCVGAWIAHTS